jgi:hypothetical protein
VDPLITYFYCQVITVDPEAHGTADDSGRNRLYEITDQPEALVVPNAPVETDSLVETEAPMEVEAPVEAEDLVQAKSAVELDAPVEADALMELESPAEIKAPMEPDTPLELDALPEHMKREISSLKVSSLAESNLLSCHTVI